MSDLEESLPPCHGLLWAWDPGTAATVDEAEVEAVLRSKPDGGRIWLHFDLVDVRARAFLRALPGLPEAGRKALVDRADTPYLDVAGDVIWGVLRDFHHEVSDVPDPAYMGLLHLTLTPSMLVTGRRHPLRALQIVRGQPKPDAGPAMRWDDILGAMLDGIGKSAAGLPRSLISSKRHCCGTAEATGPNLRSCAAPFSCCTAGFNRWRDSMRTSPMRRRPGWRRLATM